MSNASSALARLRIWVPEDNGSEPSERKTGRLVRRRRARSQLRNPAVKLGQSTRIPISCLLIVAIVLVGRTVAFPAQFDDDEFRSGLVGKYVGANQRRVSRVVPRVAFSWGDQSPDRRLPHGDFRATWEGTLLVQAEGEYRFGAVVSGGTIEIEVAGKRVVQGTGDTAKWFQSEPVSLDFDFHSLRVQYQKQDASAQVVLYWSGPDFQLEPLGARWLFHSPADSPDDGFQRGSQLARALRCGACHEIPSEPKSLSAPSLAHLDGTLQRSWLVERLQDAEAAPRQLAEQRMPHFGLAREEAEAIADYLFSASTPTDWSPPPEEPTIPTKRRSKKKPAKIDPLKEGEHLFLTIGCRACHSMKGERSVGSLFGGGALAEVGAKRPPQFFEQWLAAPESINPAHRMPVFRLENRERQFLARYLSSLGWPANSVVASRRVAADRGKQLVERLRCSGCHQLPEAESKAIARLPRPAQWTSSCLDRADRKMARPGYRLADPDRNALIYFIQSLDDTRAPTGEPQSDVGELLAERNCIACHARDGLPGLAPSLTAWAADRPDLAPLIPAMTPPALDQVGDKLHSTALISAIRRNESAYRDYLLVRMPRFPLDDAEQQQLVDHFVDVDRVPDLAAQMAADVPELDNLSLHAVGSRLVTADGFGCTSCHQIGTVAPLKAPLNTRGPSLSACGARLRREWFDRFVRNPARLNRALEMPSVRLAVRGVMDEKLDHQLAAVWDILNEPGFEPPQPDPLRVVRRSGVSADSQRAVTITDVVRTDSHVFLKPLLIGLPNRHNVLFDLESASLSRWSVGDTARQRTEGKTWYWEAGGTEVFGRPLQHPELSLMRDSEMHYPERTRQFPTEIVSLAHRDRGIVFRHDYHFSASALGDPVVLSVQQQYEPLDGEEWNGFRRRLEIRDIPAATSVRLQVVDTAANPAAVVSSDGRLWELQGGRVRISLAEPAAAKWSSDGSVVVPSSAGTAAVEITYQTGLPIDRFSHSTGVIQELLT